MFVIIIILLVGVMISCSLDDNGTEYDPWQEKWVYKPNRQDIMLDFMTKSMC